LLVDGVLLGAMSRAMNPDSPPHWLRSVVRRTWLTALVTAIVFGLVGFGIESVAPGAHTLAEAWAVEKNHK
jgi:predicted secreted protein